MTPLRALVDLLLLATVPTWPGAAALHAGTSQPPPAVATHQASPGIPALTPPRDAETAPRGTWTWPMAPVPRVVERFDPPAQRWLPGHRGVDLAGAPGQPVLAPAPGTVTFSGVIAGVGMVTVTHAGGLRTTYQPLTDRLPRGRGVTRGDQLGELAAPGSHCAPSACLHWGALTGPHVYIDPLSLLGFPPVLLPMR